MGWSDERVALLKKLWAEGHSASQIAKQIGGVTRNAVIGKVHRLGLAGRATPSRPAKRPARPRQQRNTVLPSQQPRMRQSTYQPPALSVVLEPLRFADGSVATVLTLRDDMCKFPIGNPDEADFAFCGRVSCNGPYCTDHARLAYQPSHAKRRRAEQQPDEVRRMLRMAM